MTLGQYSYLNTNTDFIETKKKLKSNFPMIAEKYQTQIFSLLNLNKQCTTDYGYK